MTTLMSGLLCAGCDEPGWDPDPATVMIRVTGVNGDKPSPSCDGCATIVTNRADRLGQTIEIWRIGR